MGCNSLTSITIPEKVTVIGNHAFNGCNSLTSITIPDSVTSIGFQAFYGCSKLTSITIPAGVTNIGALAFSECTGLKTAGLIGSESDYEFGWTTAIPSNAFSGCSNLTNITIPEGVTNIGNNAFQNCSSLTGITIPEAVTGIGGSAFSGCSSLTSISIPKNVTSIEEGTFARCSSLTDITIPESVTSIGYSAFSSCSSLTNIMIPESVTSIGGSAFSKCTNLTGITLPEGVTSIGYSAFSECESLISIIIPEGVTSIEKETFYRCYSLTSITIPISVIKILNNVFDRCNNLADVYYAGTQEQWNQITVGTGNDNLLNTTIHFEASQDDPISDIGDAYAVLQENGELLFFRSENSYKALETKQNVTDINRNKYYGYVFSGIEDSNVVPWFNYRKSISSVAVAKGQVIKPKNMVGWFMSCENLETFNSKGIDTSLIANMSNLFAYCRNLKTLDISSFDTSNVIDMSYMFRDCNALETVVLGKKFTKWSNQAYLREGIWQYQPDAIWGGTESELEWDYLDLYRDYPAQAQYWAGTWKYYDGIPHVQKISDAKFSYRSGFNDQESVTYSLEYDDSWFIKEHNELNTDLAKISMRMAMAGFGAVGTPAKNNTEQKNVYSTVHYHADESPKSTSENIVDFYETLHFKDVQVFYPIPDEDTIGFTIASKTFLDNFDTEYTLIACTIRGAGYYYEWSGNFNVGREFYHNGFNIAATTVLEKLEPYLAQYDGKKVKLWITGFSRGAAVANIVADEITDDAKNHWNKLNTGDIFAYCFECPKNMKKDDLKSHDFANIINIVNYADPVPKLAPGIDLWDYTRSGTTYYVPAMEFTKYYGEFESREMVEYINILNEVPFGKIDDISYTAFTHSYLGLMPGIKADAIINTIAFVLTDNNFYCDHLEKTVRYFAKQFLGDDPSAISKVLKYIVSVAFDALRFNVLGTFTKLSELTGEIDESGTSMTNAHYPELCLAWVDALNADEYDTDPSFRKLIFNCPIDVDVYDSNNNVVAQIKDESAYEIDNSTAFAYIDDNDQKIVILPADEEYNVVVTAREDGNMSYQVEEIDIEKGTARKITNYLDLSINKNDQYTGTIENLEIEESKYSFYDNDNNELSPSMDIEGDLSQYSLSVLREGEGTITGGGLFNVGEYAKINAQPADGFVFDGWYSGTEKIYEQPEERFRIKDNLELTGAFKGISVNLANENQIMVGDIIQLETKVYSRENPDQTVSYSSGDTQIIEVDENGLMKAVGIGKTVIRVSTNGGLERQFNISVITNGIYVKGLESDYIFSGSAIKPEISVYDSGTLLTPKTDYTVTYKNTTKAYHVEDTENPTATDKKKAPQIIIKSNSKGNYKGSKTIYFSIDPLDINDEQITVDELSVQAGTKPVNPVPVVYFNGKKLKNKTDYTVDYNGWNRLDSGDVTIKIHGKGNFQGTRDVKVNVASSDLISVAKLNVTSKTLKYADLNGDNFEEEIASAVTVKNSKKAVPAEGYHFEDIPEDYKKTGTLKFTLVGNEAAGFYGKKTVTVKITGIVLTDKKIKATVPSYVYTAEPQTLGSDFSIKYSEDLLEEGKDYTIESYSNNVNAGTATAVLKGLCNYTGTRKITFKITPADATGKAIIVDDAYYTKGGSKPKVTVEGLIEGTDFTVKYANNKAVTTANTSKLPTVTVTFKGNYKGTVTRDFYIDPKPINAVTITAKDKVYSAKANAWKSAPVLTDTDGKKLKAGVDYEKTIAYTTEDGEELPAVVEAGTVIKVTVTGKGNYTGTAETYYYILDTGKDISKMTFKIASKEYTGSAVTLTEDDITSIKLGKKEQALVLGRDYEIVSYTNNINKGTAKVTFCGINGYGGTKTVSFKIGQRSIVDYWNGIKSFFSTLF